MPHTPVDATAEYIENWQEIFGSSWVWPIIYRMLAKIELRTLLKSDGLIVPSRSALEDYFKGIPGRQKLFQLPIYEIKSGVPKLVARRCRDEILPQWGVQPRSKVVGYFGRLHFHKGYDLFCRAAEIAHEEKYENLIFVAAGRGYLPSPHYLPNFRYLGYLTEELADAVAAVDLVVVPNRVSYFDLFILEAMSLGKPVLTSRVGGNLSLDSPGIFFLKELNPKSLLSMILALLSDPRYLEEAGKANQRTYEEQYNLLVFGKRHLEFAQSILSE
ncbi:MAG: glycosyltransferase family 4 protein [Candidatus Bathyarchaeia archaeon]